MRKNFSLNQTKFIPKYKLVYEFAFKPILVTASLASVHFAETKQKKSEHVSRTTDATVDVVDAAPRGKSQPSKAVSLHGEPWYNEVVELRRQAHDYKVDYDNDYRI